MKNNSSLSTYTRYGLAILTTVVLFVSESGSLSQATVANLEEKPADATVKNATITRGMNTGTIGPTQAQVSLTDVPEKYLEATTNSPVAGTKLPHSVISSYETGNGTQTLIRIDSAEAPHRYQFPLNLPTGATAQLIEDGSVFIKNAAGETLGGYHVPWAIDANGANIPTQFTLKDGALIQSVGFTSQTAFPVIADPNDW